MSQSDLVDIRSREVVFVPFCLLNRGAVAEGMAREYRAVVKPVIQELLDHEVNIVQMPCPELQLSHYEESLKRKPKLKSDYDTPGFRAICKDIGMNVADLIEGYLRAGFVVKAVLGIEYSPSCAVSYIYQCRTPTYSSDGYSASGSGIFFEEFISILSLRKLEIPIIGIQLSAMEKSICRLRSVLSPGKEADGESAKS